MAGATPVLVRREADALTLTMGDADAEARCLSVVVELDADEDEDAAELLLPDDDALPPLEAGDELSDDLSTEVDTRRAAERLERGPQLEMKFLAVGAG